MVDLLAPQDVFSGPLRALASHTASFSEFPHRSHGESPDSWAPVGISGEGRGVVLLTEGACHLRSLVSKFGLCFSPGQCSVLLLSVCDSGHSWGRLGPPQGFPHLMLSCWGLIR